MTSTTTEPTANPIPGPDQPLLDVKDLKVHFPIERGLILKRRIGVIKAVDGVSFTMSPGDTLGLVGESGSGKTTIGRAILRLVNPTAGDVIFEGINLARLNGGEMRRTRRRIGMVFQDPYSALNPRMTAGRIIGEPMTVHGIVKGRKEYRERVAEMLRTVGLSPSMANRYPHEFSGGQRQRIGVARALGVRPSLIVLDEPVSALDVSIQAQVINLLQDLQEQFNLAYLFIAHDLSVVRHISQRVAVMYLGHIVELTSRDELYSNPSHPYTRALLSAVPTPSPKMERHRERIVLKGDIPSPANPPSGCVFHTRCPVAIEDCKKIVPELQEVSSRHWSACIRSEGYRLPG